MPCRNATGPIDHGTEAGVSSRGWQDDRVFLSRPVPRLAALALLAVLATLCLSGCVRIHAALAISPDDLVSGEVTIATWQTKPEDEGPKLTIPPELNAKVRMEKYAEEGYVGQKLTFAELRFSEVTQLTETITTGRQYRMSLRRSGDLVSMSGSLDLTQLPPERADVQIKMAFPGSVNRTNGLVEDEAIVWKPKPGSVTEMGVTAQYTDASGVSWTKWVMIVGASAVGVALIVLLLALYTHRRAQRQLADDRARARSR
jgi:hypothetical protein